MQEDQEKIPRYRVMFQDGETGVQVAAGTDNLALFTKTDLMKFVRHFKKQVKVIEDEWEEQKRAAEPDPWPTREDNGGADPSSDIQVSSDSGSSAVQVHDDEAEPRSTRKRSTGDSPKTT